MQLAAGDVEAAEVTFDALFGLWSKYEALPDAYDVNAERSVTTVSSRSLVSVGGCDSKEFRGHLVYLVASAIRALLLLPPLVLSRTSREFVGLSFLTLGWGLAMACRVSFHFVCLHRLLHYGRDSPLRPELAESALALFRATGGESRYLSAGADMLSALQRKSRVECGYASVGDVRTGVLDDRMDSYFLAETLKYLFLLFDRCVRQTLAGR